jgi:hypothetical protein
LEKLNYEELHSVYSSPDMIKMINSSRIRLAPHVASTGEENLEEEDQ